MSKMLDMNTTKQMPFCPELLPFSDDIEIINHDEQTVANFGKLALFETKFLPNDSGGVTFVGGPVTSLQFHPQAKGICAIGAHRADRHTHEILKCYQGTAHIQLWRFSFDGPSCLALIPHDGDCTWDLKWKPHQPSSDSATSWSGTLAACLGDGTIMVCYIDPSAVDTLARGSDTPCTLSPKTVLLRTRKKLSARSPVRVVEWSKDGELLAAGAADGTIEVFNAKSPEKTWPKWSIPGHDSVVMDMRWISDTHLCSLGLSCVLRMRDIRDPVATLEQNSEGLAGSFSMDALEPNVVVLGANSGYLRVIRLFGADGVKVRMPVKRVNLQTAPFRDMKSIPVSSNDSKVASQTLLYTGGSEGMLHECKFPRPIWTSTEACNIAKTENSEKLRWLLKKTTKENKQSCDHVSSTLTLQLGKEFAALAAQAAGDPENNGTIGFTSSLKGEMRGDVKSSTEGGLHNGISSRGGDLDGQESGDMPAPAGRRSARKSKSKPTDKSTRDMVYSHFGENYDQKIVISKIGVSAISDMIAIGIAGGVVTWLRLDMPFHESLAREQELHEETGKTTRKVQHVKAIPKEDKPPRKRGRPRKIPVSIDKTVSPKPPEVKPLDVRKPTSVPETAKQKDKERDKEKKEQDTVQEEDKEAQMEKEMEMEKKTRTKSLPVYGPRRRRGRPRKIPAHGENASDFGLSTKKRMTKAKNDDPSKATNPVTDQGSQPKVNVPLTSCEAITPATPLPPNSAALSYIPPDETSLNSSTFTPRTRDNSKETDKKIPPSEVCQQESVLPQSLDHPQTSSHPSLPVTSTMMTTQLSKKRTKSSGPLSSRKRRTERNGENRDSKRRRKQSPGQTKSISPQHSGPSTSTVPAQARIPLPRSTQNGASESKVEKSFTLSGGRSPNGSEKHMNELSARGGGKMHGGGEAMDKSIGTGGLVKCRLRVREGVRLRLRIRPKKETKDGLQVKLRLRTPSEDRIVEGGVKDEIHEKQEQILVEGTQDNIESCDYDGDRKEVKDIAAGEDKGGDEGGVEALETATHGRKDSEKTTNEGKGETDSLRVKLRLREGNNLVQEGRQELGQEKLHLRLRVREARNVKEERDVAGGKVKAEEQEVELKDAESGHGAVMGRAAGRSTRRRKVTWKLQERQG